MGSVVHLNRETGEVQECAHCEEKDEEITGLEATIRLQAGTIGRLRRQAEQADSIDTDPKQREIRALFKRHQKATGKTNTKLGKPRVKLVKARLRDGFPFASEEAEPTLELAIDGVAAFPYRVFNRREKTGRPSDLDNGFDRALQDEKHVESLSRYGWKARQAGWTVEDGWPDA